jgi:hypothetical protein
MSNQYTDLVHDYSPEDQPIDMMNRARLMMR